MVIDLAPLVNYTKLGLKPRRRSEQSVHPDGAVIMPKFSQRDINLIKFFESQGVEFINAKTGEKLDLDGTNSNNERSEEDTKDAV